MSGANPDGVFVYMAADTASESLPIFALDGRVVGAPWLYGDSDDVNIVRHPATHGRSVEVGVVRRTTRCTHAGDRVPIPIDAVRVDVAERLALFAGIDDPGAVVAIGRTLSKEAWEKRDLELDGTPVTAVATRHGDASAIAFIGEQLVRICPRSYRASTGPRTARTRPPKRPSSRAANSSMM